MAFLVSACSGGDEEPTQEPTAEPDNKTPVTYVAEWLVNSSTMAPELKGGSYLYREVFDSRRNSFLIQSPNHIARQTARTVVFCAATNRLDPYCAQQGRSKNSPALLAYPLQQIREWSPESLYELASRREIEIAAARDPQAWDIDRQSSNFNTPVICYEVVGETNAAPLGFQVCYTDDANRVLASLDIHGDFVLEVELVNYTRSVYEDDFVIGFEEFIEESSSLYNSLIRLYPEIPIPRPTPTPKP